MRPFGTTDQLALRRTRALQQLQQGQSPKQVAQQLSVTARSVRRWRQDAHQPKRKSVRSPGRSCRLSTAQLRRLEQALARGAVAQGYADDYWTLERIAQVIWHLFGVRYHGSGVWYLLQRLDWSSQKPQRRTLTRDDDAIAHWKRYTWPRIKKVA